MTQTKRGDEHVEVLAGWAMSLALTGIGLLIVVAVAATITWIVGGCR